jgi:hypothetical protein
LRVYLAAIAIFCNEVKGTSALALPRDFGGYAHKMVSGALADASRLAAARQVHDGAKPCFGGAFFYPA